MREAGPDRVMGLKLFAGQALGSGCVPRSPVRVPSGLPPFSLLGTARVSGKGTWEEVMWEWVWVSIT